MSCNDALRVVLGSCIASPLLANEKRLSRYRRARIRSQGCEIQQTKGPIDRPPRACPPRRAPQPCRTRCRPFRYHISVVNLQDGVPVRHQSGDAATGAYVAAVGSVTVHRRVRAPRSPFEVLPTSCRFSFARALKAAAGGQFDCMALFNSHDGELHLCGRCRSDRRRARSERRGACRPRNGWRRDDMARRKVGPAFARLDFL